MNKLEFIESELVFMGGGFKAEFALYHETDFVGTDSEVSYDVWVGADDEYINIWEGLNQAPYMMDEIPDPDMSWHLSEVFMSQAIPNYAQSVWHQYKARMLRLTY